MYKVVYIESFIIAVKGLIVSKVITQIFKRTMQQLWFKINHCNHGCSL